MIKPNFDLMLLILLISWGLSGICRIALGLANTEKDTHWDAFDAIAGFVQVGLVLWIMYT